MPPTALEQRVAQLEKIVGGIVTGLEGQSRQKDWRRTVGMFADDPIMAEIIEAGRQIREEDRRKARE